MEYMETGLADRTVIVTGANANIGFAVCLGFAAEGAGIVVVGRDEVQGERVCDQVLAHGAKDVLWCACDVTDKAQAGEMVAATRDRFTSIDVIVNCVGGNVGLDRFVDSDPTTWQRDIDLNIGTTFNCTHAVLPTMIEQRSGRIINIGSVSGIVGDPLLAVYSAMKGAVHSFTKVLAKEVGQHGITVNAIAPYGTLPTGDTDISSGSRWHPDGVFAKMLAARADDMSSMARRTVLDRQFAYPKEIAAAAVYLASDAAAFITGQILAVDGGTQIA